MTLKRFITYLFFSILLNHCFVVSAQFTAKDQSDIRKKALKVLAEYETRINQIGKDVKSIDKTRVNIEEFIKLFVNRKTNVYNDLDPAHTLSESYEAETYASNLALWYPSGILVKLDLNYAKISNIFSHGDNIYSVDFIVDKQIMGLYLGKTINSNTEKILIRVAFTFSGGQTKDFKIAGLRKASGTEQIQELNKFSEAKITLLTTDQKRDVDRETRTLLNDYANYLSLIGDTIENIEEKILYKQSFKSLFVNNQSPVYNDILPESKTQFVPVSDYINLYSEAYASDGGTVTFRMDSADLGEIMKAKDSTLFRVTEVNKSFRGSYLGKRKVKYSNKISLRIVFEFSGTVFKNFRIERIDPVSYKKQENIEQRTFFDLKSHKLATSKSTETDNTGQLKKFELFPESSKINIGLGIMAGLGKISDGNINELNNGNVSYEWKTKPKFCYSAYGLYTFKLSPKIGLTMGVGYSSLGTEYSLNSGDTAFVDSYNYRDTNNTVYKKMLWINYDSTVSMNFINIPVGLIYYLKTTNNFQYFIKPSINIGIVSKAIAKINKGKVSYTLLYPDDTIPLTRVREMSELGAYSYAIADTEKNIKTLLNTIYISVGISAGVAVPLTSKIILNLSGGFQYGLTDLKKKKDQYEDYFYKTEFTTVKNHGQSESNKKHVSAYHAFPHKPTRIITYGIAVEFIVKL